MSLIASLGIPVAGKVAPFLLGDLAISEPARGHPAPFDIPTQRDVNRLLPPWRLISGLTQKLVLLSGNIAVAWAGSELAARLVIKDLQQRASGPHFDDDALFRYLHDSEYFDRELRTLGLSLLGLVLRPGGRVIRFAWDREHGQIPRLFPPIAHDDIFGEVYAAGSGSGDLLQRLKQGLQVVSADAGDAARRQASHLLMQSLVGLLLSEQVRSGFGIDSYWGGGLELIGVVDGELRKIGGVTYLSLDLLHLENKLVFNLPAMKVDYDGDLLMVSSLREVGLAEPERLGLPPTAEKVLFVLTPVRADAPAISRETIREPSLQSRVTVFSVHLPQVKGAPARVLVHQSAPEGPPAFTFNEATGELALQEGAAERIRRLTEALRNTPRRCRGAAGVAVRAEGRSPQARAE